ncbi:MAG: hypothetical protein L3J12_04905, partial [Spirochaetales bacterium]|nr:hypothetical protein [Spirochaetales bacterium]
MGEAQQKFVKILNEIFEMDKSDLDFGIYRIMNVKRDLITDYTETKFPEKVQNILAEYKDNSHEKVKIDLAEAIKQAEALGADPDTLPKVKELKSLLTDIRDFSDIENEVYNHLAIFFRRYYDKGDFISRRRYKGDTYAIPYSGEEVKLYWANADQYYIKTGEHYKDYVFKISDGRKVHFKIVEVEGEQKDNNKDDKKRFFVLRKEKPFTVENRELVLSFEYRNESVSGKNAQINLNKAAVEGFSKSEWANDWKLLLEIVNPKDKKDKQQTFLQKQLYKYTARNSYDYFIHKDIKTFLQRELDFYIKNEVMFLDDIEYAKEVSLKQQLDQIRAIKAVGQDIIDFITQFEEFQKKLWLKKK